MCRGKPLPTVCVCVLSGAEQMGGESADNAKINKPRALLTHVVRLCAAGTQVVGFCYDVLT